MASVTQTIPNFLGGVSNQPDDKKLPGQVRQAINAYPDPTFGLTKRPGFKYIMQLKDSGGTVFDNADLDAAKWFYINRDADEKYIGCIVGASASPYGTVNMWNTVDKATVAITYGSNTREYLGKKESADAVASILAADYDVITVRDTTIITNKNRVVTAKTTAAHVANKVATAKIHKIEYSAKYEVKIKCTSNSTIYTATVNTRAGDTPSNDADQTGHLDADEILTAIRTAIIGHSIPGIGNGAGDGSGTTNGRVDVIDSSLEISSVGSAFTIEVVGGKDSQSLTAYQDEVTQVTELASQSKHDRIVTIVNTFDANATYYAKFKADNEDSGVGIWEETIGPGQDLGLASVNMPHRLRRTAKNAYTFEVIEDDPTNYAGVFGAARLVGNDTTNAHPSFKGSTIQQAFYSNNRFGFLTGDNVSLGVSGDYFNFYHKSAKTVVDSDPIDLSCSSTKEATLHGVIPTATGLLLFSQNQQFLMYAADGNLAPKTALIRGLSNFKMDKNIDPVDVGTHVNFVSKTHDTAGYSRIFSMIPQGVGQIPKVIDIGRSVSEYIPATITGLTANTQNSLIAMWGNDANKIYFYRTYSDGEQDLVQSWFNWECPGNVHLVEVDSDTMYSVIKNGTGNAARYNLVSATMTMTPEETIIVTADGQQVNPHMDYYTAATNGLTGGSEKKVVYDSTNDFSKCYIPYSDVTTLDPVIVIAGNATSNFSGTTESGFTLTPTRGSDGDGTYFKVPNKNLSAQAANVYVGYKYSYDITLPKIYYRKDPEGKLSDFTANLTISRMKFSIGKSSEVGFKLNRKGVQAATDSFTGDGSTTAFSPSFDVIDLKDVVVKKNGAKQALGTDYTIAAHATLTDKCTVTFGSAPAAATTTANVTTAADSIEIYIDNWYTLLPTQNANYYLGDDVPIEDQNIFTVPIHQRTDNYTLRVFSDSPFPVSLTAMSWEGVYSPRYYRRV